MDPKDASWDSRPYRFHEETNNNGSTPTLLANIPWPRPSAMGVPPAPNAVVQPPTGFLYVDATVAATLSDGSKTVTMKQRAQVGFTAGATPGTVVTNTINTLPTDGGAAEGFTPTLTWSAVTGALRCSVSGVAGVVNWDGVFEVVWNDGSEFGAPSTGVPEFVDPNL